MRPKTTEFVRYVYNETYDTEITKPAQPERTGQAKFVKSAEHKNRAKRTVLKLNNRLGTIMKDGKCQIGHSSVGGSEKIFQTSASPSPACTKTEIKALGKQIGCDSGRNTSHK